MARFVFWETPPEPLAAAAPLHADLAALQMRLALLKLAHKYRPDQPRVPAGSRDGGQWTYAGDGWVRVAANDRGRIATDALAQPAAEGVISKRVDGIPPDSVSYSTPDGTVFLAPAGANFQKVYEDGHALTGLNPNDWPAYIKQKVGQFGEFDFQRDGHIFYSCYTDASNYAAGLFMSGAGFSYADTVAIAGGYAAMHSAGGITGTRLRWWTYGYMAGYLNSSVFPLPTAALGSVKKAWFA